MRTRTAIITALAIGGMAAPVAHAGTPITGDVPVNTFTTGQQEFQSIAAGDDGYVVTWYDYLDAVKARQFSAAGAPLGGEITVREAQVYSTDVAAWPDGRFVVVWHEFSPGPSEEVRARVYSSAGMPIGDVIGVNATTAGHQKYPSVSIAPDGAGFVVAWDDDSSNTLMLKARRYTAAGAPITAELNLSQEGNADTQVVAQSGGSFVVAWTHGDDALARRYDGVGAPLTPAAELTDDTVDDASQPRIARGPGDAIVAAWTALNDAYWRRFASDLTPLAPRAVANVDEFGSQAASDIAVAADGRVVVAWEDDDAEYRRFNADGSPITGELVANADAAGGQYFPSVAVRPNGDFGVAWADSNGDDIEARFFTTPEGPGATTPPQPTPPPPTPPASTPPQSQPLPPPDAPEFSDFVTFSSNKSCVKRIKLEVKDAIRITARIKGKKVATKVKPKIVIKKLPKGRFKLEVTVVSKDGKTFDGARKYKSCARAKPK